VQVVRSSQRGSREIEHLGSAHDEAELEMLKAAARKRIAAGRQSPTWALRRRVAARCRSPPPGWAESHGLPFRNVQASDADQVA
jgi:hypothetical protein